MALIDLIRFVLVGFVSGWIAAIVVRGRILPRGCVGYVIIGVSGALIGGYIFRTIGLQEVPRVIGAFVGSVLVLFLLRGARRG